jgi:tetratricopeptide (TPR) repeat protein
MKDKSEFYCTLGRFYEHTAKDYPSAIDAYSRAIECKGAEYGGTHLTWYKDLTFYYYKPYIALAVLLTNMGLYPEALFFAKKALESKPGDPIASKIAENLGKITKMS